MFPYIKQAINQNQGRRARMFRRIRQVAAPDGPQTTLFGRDGQMAAPGAKSAVADCIVLPVEMG